MTEERSAVHTVSFHGVLYVLHVFLKKSKRGIKTPREEIEVVKSRLRFAREHYEQSKRRKDRHD